MATTFTSIFLILLALTSLTRIWLGRRHISFIGAHRAEVPAERNVLIDRQVLPGKEQHEVLEQQRFDRLDVVGRRRREVDAADLAAQRAR